jgi:high affinity Mn2+ porin
MVRKNSIKLKSFCAFLVLNLIICKVYSQQADTLTKDRFSIHMQTTIITQYKPAFDVKYSGRNSLVPKEETRHSIQSTLFLGAKLWKGASIFINPGIVSGSGLGGSLGVGA